MKKIVCTFQNRETGNIVAHKTFTGNTYSDAALLAANFVSSHPELKSVNEVFC